SASAISASGAPGSHSSGTEDNAQDSKIGTRSGVSERWRVKSGTASPFQTASRARRSVMFALPTRRASGSAVRVAVLFKRVGFKGSFGLARSGALSRSAELDDPTLPTP